MKILQSYLIILWDRVKVRVRLRRMIFIVTLHITVKCLPSAVDDIEDCWHSSSWWFSKRLRSSLALLQSVRQCCSRCVLMLVLKWTQTPDVHTTTSDDWLTKTHQCCWLYLYWMWVEGWAQCWYIQAVYFENCLLACLSEAGFAFCCRLQMIDSLVVFAELR